jgi:hypothetical protein
LNHKHTTLHLDEPISTAKSLSVDHKMSQPSITSANNLLRPDSNPWNTNNNDGELLKNKSPSISNIAGK